jgi:hypothetical protein
MFSAWFFELVTSAVNAAAISSYGALFKRDTQPGRGGEGEAQTAAGIPADSEGQTPASCA